MLLAILLASVAGVIYLYLHFRPSCISLSKQHSSISPYTPQLHNPIPPPSAKPLPHPSDPPNRLPLSPRIPTTGPSPAPTRLIVAMTGATGSILAVRLLQVLQRMNIESYLVISKWAAATLVYETDYTVKDLRSLATKSYSAQDVAASISSGSFRTHGMVIVPCSMKTLSAVANGYGDDLITRAADVTLKERRRLVVVARETPLTGIHLRNMMTVTENGGIVFPPVPAFYTRPRSVEDIVKQSVGRILDMFGLDTGEFERWEGM